MKLTWTHIGLALLGLASASVGLVIKRYQLESGVVTTGKTEVRVKVTVRGRGGRAVKNAKISIFEPEQIILGNTNNDGMLEKRVLLKSGKAVVLQAEGIAFKMRRDVLIPRSNQYQATIFFDLAEVHEGNATLLSVHNSESTALLHKPTPRPVWFTFNLEALKLTENNKDVLTQQLKRVADSMDPSEPLKLTCKTLQENPPVHECVREKANGEMFFFLVNDFPSSSENIRVWLSSVRAFKTPPQDEKVAHTDTLFVVRHGGQKVTAYLDNMPLPIWKSKSTSNIYRASLPPQERGTGKVELTVVTEEGQVLQKRISWPAKRKVIVTRLPQNQTLNLSRRETQK